MCKQTISKSCQWWKNKIDNFLPILTAFSTCGSMKHQITSSVALFKLKKSHSYIYWFLIHVTCYSVVQLCPTLCEPMDCSTPGLPVLHHLPKFAQVHVHCIGDAIQLSHPLMPFSPSAFNLSQHPGIFQWVSCSHQMTKILEIYREHHAKCQAG